MHWFISFLIFVSVPGCVLGFQVRYKRASERSASSFTENPPPSYPECIKKFAQLINSTFIDTNFSFYNFNTSKSSLGVTWIGNNSGQLLVTLTEEYIVGSSLFGAVIKNVVPSEVFISRDNGASFENVTNEVNIPLLQDGLVPQNSLQGDVYLMGYPEKQNNFLVTPLSWYDGIQFQRYSIPGAVIRRLDFHPVNRGTIITQNEKRLLLASTNFGKSWTTLLPEHYFQKQVWNPWRNNSLFALSFSSQADENSCVGEMNIMDLLFNYPRRLPHGTLYAFDLQKLSSYKLLDHVYNFGISGRFMYATVFLSFCDSSQRIMVVSTDQGSTWLTAVLPILTPSVFYTVLEADLNVIFLHIDGGSDSAKGGAVYVSNANGTVYSQSLRNNLFKQHYTDFYKVQSSEGTYITTVVEDGDVWRSMITFNRGATWQWLRIIDSRLNCTNDSVSDRCQLQVVNQNALKLRNVQGSPPLSTTAAVGIILVHGFAGPSFKAGSQSDVFVSSDGGLSWQFALSGPKHYEIAGHGSLLVAVDMGKAQHVWFSTDEGSCWIRLQVSPLPFEVTGIYTEPGGRALSLSIWGYDDLQKQWRVSVLNLSSVFDGGLCTKDDMELWPMHSQLNKGTPSEGCLLGKKIQIYRVRKDSSCYHDYSFERENQTVPCDCTEADFQCDFGFIRDNTGQCVVDKTSNNQLGNLSVCVHGRVEELQFVGYHRVSGDSCQMVPSGFKPNAPLMTNETCATGNWSNPLIYVGNVVDDRSAAGGRGSRLQPMNLSRFDWLMHMKDKSITPHHEAMGDDQQAAMAWPHAQLQAQARTWTIVALLLGIGTLVGVLLLYFFVLRRRSNPAAPVSLSRLLNLRGGIFSPTRHDADSGMRAHLVDNEMPPSYTTLATEPQLFVHVQEPHVALGNSTLSVQSGDIRRPPVTSNSASTATPTSTAPAATTFHNVVLA